MSSINKSPVTPIPQPRWTTTSRQPRPRLTWRLILFSAPCLYMLYALYCIIYGLPVLASPLPSYTGPHGVGAIDLEVPLPGGPRRVAEAVHKATGQPVFDVETLLATVYYPTDRRFRSRKPRYPWIPRPISLTAQGYARLAGIDNLLIRTIFTGVLWVVGGAVAIPAEVDAPLLLRHYDNNDTTDAFPVTVFSHGDVSSRTDYTQFLAELASRGHVIIAIEHRDGSGPGSLVKSSASSPGRPVPPLRLSDIRSPSGLPTEFARDDFKRAQLAFRDAEFHAAVDLLHAINNGTPILNTRDPITTLPSWTGRLNMTHLTLAGHSFGATGALQALTTTRSTSPAAGVILDPGKSSGPLNPNVTVPILVVHSNSWSRTVSPFYNRPHFDTVRDLVRAVPAPSWFLTSIGTAHPSITDAPLLEPWLLSWTTGATLNVHEALREYVRVTDDFFHYVREGGERGILGEKATHHLYDEWVSPERQREFPPGLARLWQVHVTPVNQTRPMECPVEL
ncbi:PAF acetylhydrolase [Aspergillus brunneoviolaceus CBS 621.78]|uniref:PAF acetylhydrolase n=1 Tax=Aspergillus brunneoviolaceus CBS 621.78 TaxID=1450534 RepID=A0ACD1GHW5_9EURO|nr:PAF acetylhydrolase [Aspergillus brunneoviolaceus CBS 621.78]RAH48745.1 PAF acetylhydrolase [Aspergillus brunneoviolaceus CBS 621.78]